MRHICAVQRSVKRKSETRFRYIGTKDNELSFGARPLPRLGSNYLDCPIQPNCRSLCRRLESLGFAVSIRRLIVRRATRPPDPLATTQAPWLRNGMCILSAMFLLDDASTAAQTGIEEPANW